MKQVFTAILCVVLTNAITEELYRDYLKRPKGKAKK
jgi:hypothetical protein